MFVAEEKGVLRFKIKQNEFLEREIDGYFNCYYRGYKNEGNPDFLNCLKNTFGTKSRGLLQKSMAEVEWRVLNDLPIIMKDKKIENCVCVCVPRSKRKLSYSDNQLYFNEAVKKAVMKISNVSDGTNAIIRHTDTFTTHLRNAKEIENNGKSPYPGITKDTCDFTLSLIQGKTIILIDDIYTKNVNIDEDCIQSLLEHGAKEVVFYAIGFTKIIT